MPQPGTRWLPMVVGFTMLCGCATENIAALGARMDRGPQPEVRTLRNSLQVVLVRDDREPIVAVTLVVGAGAAHDPPARGGLAHLVEHLGFEGQTADGVTARERMRASGVVENGYTRFDHTTFIALAHRELWHEVVAAQLARLADPLQGIDEPGLRHEID